MDKIVKSDAEWKEELGPEAFKVLRGHGTERAGTHEDFPKEAGTYRCKACGTPLFDQAHKFESGTGWPSFWQPVDGVESQTVEESVDNSWFMKRTEVHCARCDGHLGHVFPDGPKPTGLRYCINGVALDFESAE